MTKANDSSQQREGGDLTPAEPEPASTPTPGTGGRETAASGDETAALRHEAAGYRRERNEAREERDALLARIDRHDRAEVERIASEHMANPADLFLVIDGLDDLRDDDREISQATVEQAIEKALEERPHWRKARIGLDGGVRSQPQQSRSIGEAMKQATGGGR